MHNNEREKQGEAVLPFSDPEIFTHHVEDISSPDESYGPPGLRGLIASPYVAACAAFSALGGLLFGYDQGAISITLVMPQFLQKIGEIAGFRKGLLTAMIELGACIGALNQGWIADKYSRRYSILIAVAVFTVGSILQTASIDYAMLIVARFIGGIGIGMLSMVAPLYISEISPKEIRGSLLVLEEFSIVSGIVIAYWITYGTRYMSGEWAWRLPFLLQMIPGCFLAIGVIFLPFSPRWLVYKNRNQDALRTLSKLRTLPTTEPRVQKEWIDIRAEISYHKEVSISRHPTLQGKSIASQTKLEFASWIDCFKHGCWKRTNVGILMMLFQQFVGINALIYYSPTLFQSMGLDYDMQLIMSGVLNVTQLFGVSTSVWTMDKFGRRPLLMVGGVLMTISHIVIAVLVGLFDSDWPGHRLEGWISVGFLLFYMLSFGASWGPVPWAYPAEIFPSTLRAKGVSLTTVSNWFNNFIIGLITPPLVEDTGYGAYVFFGVFCCLATVWTFFCVPETKGRSLEQMDMIFGDSTSEKEDARRAAIREELAANDQF